MYNRPKCPGRGRRCWITLRNIGRTASVHVYCFTRNQLVGTLRLHLLLEYLLRDCAVFGIVRTADGSQSEYHNDLGRRRAREQLTHHAVQV